MLLLCTPLRYAQAFGREVVDFIHPFTQGSQTAVTPG